MTTKILLLSDIHANFPALDALVRQVRITDFDLILNCGDSVVYGPFPNETVDWLRHYNVISILGNTDLKVIRLAAGKSMKKPRKPEKRIMYTWTVDQLTPGNIAFLRGLPEKKTIAVGKHRVCLFHGSSDSMTEHLFTDTPTERFAELAYGTDCKIVVTGHSHTPYTKEIGSVHFINPGSAGRMFDGNPAGSFAILTLQGKKVHTGHFRLPYSVEEVIKALRRNYLPSIYEEMFVRGRKLN